MTATSNVFIALLAIGLGAATSPAVAQAQAKPGAFQRELPVAKADLTHTGTNPYFTLVPGHRLTLEGLDVDHVPPGIGRKIMQRNARLVSQGPDLPRMNLLAIEDITARRRTERRLVDQRAGSPQS